MQRERERVRERGRASSVVRRPCGAREVKHIAGVQTAKLLCTKNTTNKALRVAEPRTNERLIF